MKPRRIRKLINLDVYPVGILLIVDKDVNSVRRSLPQFFGIREFKEVSGSIGTDGGGNFCLVFSLEDMSHELIAHEVFHLVACICHHLGISPDPQNQEPGAYLCSSITRRIYEETLGGKRR